MLEDRSCTDSCGPSGVAEDHSLQDRWNPFINRSARNLARSIKDRAWTADDLAQAARIRLFRLGPSAASRNWTGKVLFNEMRREAGRPATHGQLEARSYSVADETIETESTRVNRVAVRDWLARLPQSLADVYDRIYVWGESQREAAAHLGCSQSRVSQLHNELLRRGRRELSVLAA